MQSKKTLIALAVAGLFSSAGAFAGDEMQSNGYRGWGPMANLETPYSPSENSAIRYDEEMRDRAQHVAEVNEMREQVWMANAPLREMQEHNVASSEQNMLLKPFRELARLLNFHKGETPDEQQTQAVSE